MTGEQLSALADLDARLVSESAAHYTIAVVGDVTVEIARADLPAWLALRLSSRARHTNRCVYGSGGMPMSGRKAAKVQQ